ncbi:MAG: response regulator transcription factor, partial [Clostridium sp.]|nr:response regulator transcription factor [Clostridium sp.]
KLNNINLILLDVMLPDGNGYEYCEKLRRREIDVPIIFLTAMSDEVNVVQGLDRGGDDYITKPFGVKELISRVNALLRRYNKVKELESNNKDLIRIGEITINKKRNTLKVNNNNIVLTPSEYRLLIELVENKNNIVERGSLIQKLWDIDGEFVDDNTLSVYIKRLRNKIEENPSKPKRIITIRGIGYSFREYSEE